MPKDINEAQSDASWLFFFFLNFSILVPQVIVGFSIKAGRHVKLLLCWGGGVIVSIVEGFAALKWLLNCLC